MASSASDPSALSAPAAARPAAAATPSTAGPGAAAAARPDQGWPRIGLPTYVEPARWGAWDRPAALLPHSYVAAVVAAGGVPVLLPPVVPLAGPSEAGDAGSAPAASDGHDPAETRGQVAAVGAAALEAAGRTAARSAVDGIDALLLTGGADIEPGRYGAGALATTQAARRDRDRWEADLLAEALARDLPVLAVCRGLQVLNVAAGGTLHQHLPDLVGHTGHQPGQAVLGATPVHVAEGSLAATILGTEVKVPCYHHQAIDRLGTGVEAVGWADDGVIEAVVLRDRRFVLGVQWHPEDGDDPRLFTALVAAAQATER